MKQINLINKSVNYYISGFRLFPSIQFRCEEDITVCHYFVTSSAASFHRLFDLRKLIDSLSIYFTCEIFENIPKKIRKEFDWKMINESVINACAVGNTVPIIDLKQRWEMKRDDIDYRHRYLWPAQPAVIFVIETL